MALKLLFGYQPAFYTAISSYLPTPEQEYLERVCKAAQSLVDSANSSDFKRLESTSVYADCREEIDRLNKPRKTPSEKKGYIRSAVPLINAELKNSCKVLAIPGAAALLSDQPLSMAERVKLAEQVDETRAIHLIRFFSALSEKIPEAQAFETSLTQREATGEIAGETREIAREIRAWMHENPELLFQIKSLNEIGGIASYCNRDRFSLPSEALSLKEMDQEDFYQICAHSLRSNYHHLTRKIVENPRLLQLPPKLLGKLLKCAVASGNLPFINTLMGSEPFDRIPGEYLRVAFEVALQSGDYPVVQAFIANRRFGELPIESIDRTLAMAVEQRDLATVRVLAEDNRFDLIDVALLSRLVDRAVRKGRPDLVKVLLNTRRSHSIPYEKLQGTLETAYSMGIFEELRRFFKFYGKDGDVVPSTLERKEFGTLARSIISGIREDHEEMGDDSGSELDEEEDFKENRTSFSLAGKRLREPEQVEQREKGRRRTNY